MDPLSVTAGVIALCSALKVLSRGIKNLIDLGKAPREIYELHNELATITGYLDLVASTLTSMNTSSTGQSPSGLDHLGTIVTRVTSDVQELQEIATKVQAGFSDSARLRRQKARLGWKLFETSNITTYRNKIRRERDHMADAFRIMQQSYSEMQLTLIQDLHNMLESRLDQATDALNAIRVSTHQIDSHGQHTNTEADNQVMHPQTPVRRKCAADCRCQCHKRSDISSPQTLTGFLGWLCMRYGGFPSMSKLPCNSRQCLNNGNSPLHLGYVFPSWLARRAFSLTTYWDSMPGLSTQIKFPRIIPTNHQVWFDIERNDVGALQRLISNKEICLTDIDKDGYSFLLAIVEFLLTHGSNVDCTHQNKRSPLVEAQRLYLLEGPKPGTSAERELLKKVISRSELDYSYPTLAHEVIVGGKQMPLLEALRIEPWALNVQNLTGFTPLHWAVMKGNIDHLQRLIDQGADVEALDFAGRTPLHWAVQDGNTECAGVLLRAGYNINASSVQEPRTPLFLAIQSERYNMVHFLLEP
ncbi:ankyrin repeat-containing domain protein [Cercophora scortea]|uniref:Ankyrin repeat-containing domain protein n=1 Tax=Cercophora scortea TaxID=314031 RepID=A0AAE0IDW3_9PEZI|nr:ankyrin repeat-containing domain protein [Cercophora scortea]